MSESDYLKGCVRESFIFPSFSICLHFTARPRFPILLPRFSNFSTALSVSDLGFCHHRLYLHTSWHPCEHPRLPVWSSWQTQAQTQIHFTPFSKPVFRQALKMIRMGGGPGADPEAEKKAANQVRSPTLFFSSFFTFDCHSQTFDKLFRSGLSIWTFFRQTRVVDYSSGVFRKFP